MDTWNCCRMCLGSHSLYPIFSVSEYHEKYTEILLSTTGIKVALNDNLPQQICTSCINFINNSYKFRKKCEENQNLLTKRCNVETHDIKTETIVFIVKPEDDSQATIDISHLIGKDFNDKDSCNDYSCDFNNDVIEFESKPQDIVEEKISTVFNDKKRKRRIEKPVKKSLRKRESGEKKERVKEKIECEYCQKILTSKLSLRNHYKIHTGFDVVCEHCGKKFITRRLLLMHCRAKHGYEKTDKCSYCDYTASNAEQVKIHERLHTGEKPFVCAECGASFHRKSSYLQHVAIHLPDKTVQCEQCPARFKSVTLMKIHANRHRAAQYSFKCRVCDNSFARRRNVVRHLARIHGLHPQPDMIDRLKIA